MTLLASFDLSLPPLGVTQLSSEFGGCNLTCKTLPLSLRSGPYGFAQLLWRQALSPWQGPVLPETGRVSLPHAGI